jgi:hypothetical protein
MIEAAFNVSFDNPQVLILGRDAALAGSYAVHCSSAWSKPIGTVQKVTFPDRFQEHLEGHLNHAVFEGGDA